MVSKPDCLRKSDVARTILETEFKFNSFIIDLIKVCLILKKQGIVL